MRVSFEEVPNKWGILIPRSGHYRNVRPKDLELLQRLRNHFRDEYYGRPIPYKQELRGQFECRGALDRLWGAGFIEKFSTTFHTLSGRPNYISWYIWEDKHRLRHRGSVPQFIED